MKNNVRQRAPSLVRPVPVRDTVLATADNQRAFHDAYRYGGEFRVMVRHDYDPRPDHYSGPVAMAIRLRRPKGFPNGFAFAIRIRPKVPLDLKEGKTK